MKKWTFLKNALIMTLTSLILRTVGIFFRVYLSDKIEKVLGEQGLMIVSRLMGLFVCALAAQIIMTGVRGYFLPQ